MAGKTELVLTQLSFLAAPSACPAPSLLPFPEAPAGGSVIPGGRPSPLPARHLQGGAVCSLGLFPASLWANSPFPRALAVFSLFLSFGALPSDHTTKPCLAPHSPRELSDRTRDSQTIHQKEPLLLSTLHNLYYGFPVSSMLIIKTM